MYLYQIENELKKKEKNPIKNVKGKRLKTYIFAIL
jgi:hypothetical protein